ncbi:MAG: DUF1786 domain-containing protein [Chloroflexota bacterium]
MKILTVDIGTGTQDIFLYDSRLDMENGFKLVVPSPTMIVRQQIMEATRRQDAILLSGVTMGGGPNSWAAEAHLRAGLQVFATPDAARTFNDDLEAVSRMGIQLISQDEAAALPVAVRRIGLRDFDFIAIERALDQFGVSLEGLSAIAVAVFDHGNAPPGVSDRQFRFDYLDERIRAANRLSAFAFLAEQAPPIMTRLQAVVQSARSSNSPRLQGLPLVVMDTAPAAVLGATFDPRLRQAQHSLIANVGNFHTLAFRLGPGSIEGVFEHHTGLLDRPKLESLLRSLADGSLKHADVFADHGHGALIYQPEPFPLDEGDFGVVVTGPRRSLLRGSELRPYFAVPFGDMMIAGCFGLLAACADLLPELREALQASLRGDNRGIAPWDET